MQINHFLGTWALDPGQSRYEMGSPPASGSYIIEAEGERLVFRMGWTAVNGDSHTASYDGVPDGNDYALAETAVADTVCLFFEDDHNLVSTAKRANALILHARRTLSADLSTMTIVQSGQAETGPYANYSVYKRIV